MTRAGLMREVNRGVRLFADEPDSDTDASWEFFCECGAEGCFEHILISPFEFDALRRAEAPVLAPGHPPLTPDADSAQDELVSAPASS